MVQVVGANIRFRTMWKLGKGETPNQSALRRLVGDNRRKQAVCHKVLPC